MVKTCLSRTTFSYVVCLDDFQVSRPGKVKYLNFFFELQTNLRRLTNSGSARVSTRILNRGSGCENGGENDGDNSGEITGGENDKNDENDGLERIDGNRLRNRL
ncbi:hypothetical protein F2Q69_00004461 [Brassica cretica]|uniref:Uncharacterized protein n=1 Tax=Brassica cretica TaxID=69181 RepID=A0A8S9P6F1_BRACR|nr:hypothetical protein F2Q69_00004461 [Brassica cretica]